MSAAAAAPARRPANPFKPQAGNERAQLAELERRVRDVKAAAAVTDRSVKDAAGGTGPAAGAAKKPRYRPFGYGLVERASAFWLVVMLCLLYAITQALGHPLAHLQGQEVVIQPRFALDGDSFLGTVQPDGHQARFRLKRIDAPELDQPYGKDAKRHLDELLADADGDLDLVGLIDGQDEHGRYVVDLVARRGVGTHLQYVQESMLKAGMAWAFASFGRHSKLGEAMAEAKEAKRGLWAQDAPVEPWKHRRLGKRKPGDTDGGKDRRGAGGGAFGRRSRDDGIRRSDKPRPTRGEPRRKA